DQTRFLIQELQKIIFHHVGNFDATTITKVYLECIEALVPSAQLATERVQQNAESEALRKRINIELLSRFSSRKPGELEGY
ncbi:hypothetical protein, partial [Streptococcus pneumoniae]|uniref:hypothetical protein n=1 Tax=Streptococcus pneumoniae TaxID=1313 RepID=UPI001E4B0822